jgi:hypothetical protein
VTLARFPRRTLRADRVIHRLHRVGNRPWWFSSDGSGRFDPVGTSAGACYLAEHPLGAWVEVFRKRMLLDEAEVRARALLSVSLGRDLRLADLTSRRALGFGVTASLGANREYAASQELAVGLVEAGFDGIRYLVRHDPAQRLFGVALFAPAGAPADEAVWPTEPDRPLPKELLDEARRTFGYRIVPPP